MYNIIQNKPKRLISMTRCYLLCRPIEQGLEGEAVLQGELRWS